MKKLIVLIVAAALWAVEGHCEDVVIKAPGFNDGPIRDSHPLFPDSLVFPRDAEEICIPDIGEMVRLGQMGYDFPKLRKITFGNVDYLPGGLLYGMPALEEVVFDGFVGHFDCIMAGDCPNLRKITFRGPVSSTGGPGFLYDLPNLEEVEFNGVVVDFGVDVTDGELCPKFKGFTNNAAFIKVYNENSTPAATIEELRQNPRLIADMERIARWESEVLSAANSGWMRKNEFQTARILQPVLAELGSPMADSLKAAMDYAWNLGDDVKTNLDVLKESPVYASGDTKQLPEFRYASSADSMLAASRRRFRLDRVAGNGDDISRIKNLLYWVHDNITHDGSNGLAPGERNLANTYDSARRDSCGYNCRALAICLTEALLAEGIPARYITCIPKDWENDNDCHVICTAWSESLGKWIWVDPTFAAYVMDENGLLLHPGEVRYRLQNDLPLILNEDANWNNRSRQKKEYYLDVYMAKNLYFLDSNTLNQAEPEGPSAHVQGEFITLVPAGTSYPNTHHNTSDEAWFWQAPLVSND